MSEKFVDREKNLVGKNCGQKKHIVGGGKIGQKNKIVRKKMLVRFIFGWKQNFGQKICQVGIFFDE